MEPTCRTISATPSFKKGGKQRVYYPDEGSLYDVIAKNARLRLFVKPIKWTDFHLNCLGDTSPGCHRVPTKPALDLINALTHMLGEQKETQRTYWIRTAMFYLYPNRLSCIDNTGFHHYFGHRAYLNTCRVEVVWETKPSRSSCLTSGEPKPTWSPGAFNVPTGAKTGKVIESSQHILAYVDTRVVDATRRSTYKIRRDSAPVKGLNKVYYKTFTPLNACHDPFLAGVFLALAQRLFYGEPMPPAAKLPNSVVVSPRVKAELHDVAVHILTVDDKDSYSPYFLVYKGVVTEALLRKFDHPAENPQPEGEADGMRIEYTRVRIWPVLGLRERLGKALGTDIIGNFNKDNDEMWVLDHKPNDGRNKRQNNGEVQSSSHDGSDRRKKLRKYTKALFSKESVVI
ncbi:hypothetical protein ColLi_13306 [Colletotrichum liriopes]|uniref:Uncharacterized protein n=1 Tax=Colletotrichum liriopes TaxID=708192 RepID=A0AA37GZZ2_9PEZI|nr:hypothetical protein ColLi_13306 [Colletotrichum liriopes]